MPRIAYPTWGNIEWGFANDDDADMRAFPRVIAGSIRKGTADFSFPGVDGIWTAQFGRRGRPILWQVTVAFKDATTMKTFEETVELAIDGPTYDMTALGRTFYDVELRVFDPGRSPLIALGSPWLAAKVYSLMFMEHNP